MEIELLPWGSSMNRTEQKRLAGQSLMTQSALSADGTQPPSVLHSVSALRYAAGQVPFASPWLLTVSAIWLRSLRSICNGLQACDSTLATLGARLEFAALFGLNHEDVLP